MNSIRQSKSKTLLDQANATLIAQALNFTADDKKAALTGLSQPVSRYTINSYLKGEAQNLTLALKIIRFFKKRIVATERELTKAAA